jgi:phosphatidylserine/phosphatidylglycerophosphate/cardiolipin synthase-like enzyme
MGRFAVGYLFLSGLTSIAEHLENIKELKLLIGNTTNRETLEQLAEGYRRLELVAENLEIESYPKKADARRINEETGENVRAGVELMDQTDEAETLVHALVRMIEEKRLKVRVYAKGRLHAKAYIFDYGTVFDGTGKPVEHHEKGIAIVGSSNLTLAGVTHSTELNVVVQGNDNHAELVRWLKRSSKGTVAASEMSSASSAFLARTVLEPLRIKCPYSLLSLFRVSFAL